MDDCNVLVLVAIFWSQCWMGCNFVGCKTLVGTAKFFFDCKVGCKIFFANFSVANFFCCMIAKIFFWLQSLVARLAANFFGCHLRYVRFHAPKLFKNQIKQYVGKFHDEFSKMVRVFVFQI